MAQVLAPILQTSASITMPYSPPDAYQNAPGQPHLHQSQQQQRSTQPPRNQMYNSHSAGTGYRGTSAPIAPYAFSSTPQLRQEGRSVSAPISQAQQHHHMPPPSNGNQARKGHPSHPSSSSDSTVSTSGSSSRSMAGPSRATKDDSDIKKLPEVSTGSFMTSSSIPDLSLSMGDAPVKPSPGRYRRGAGRTDSSSSVPTSGSTATSTQQSTSHVLPPSGLSQTSSNSPPTDSDISSPSRPGHNRANSADDTQLPRTGGVDAAKRYRRRSFNGLDADGVAKNMAASSSIVPQNQASNTSASTVRPGSSAGRQSNRPTSSHQRQSSTGSVSSNVSTKPQASNTSAQRASAPGAVDSVTSKAADAARRHAPSPLSHPVSNETPSPAKAPVPSSAAVKQLTAVNEKDKGMKSRLRRAFSFGSAAELRRASAENNISAERAKLRKDRLQGGDSGEEDPEQAAIIAKQEAAGIGAGIYSGQGGVGSTDNISIQSAASSASIMLRKMGSGMKKGTKSIKGLFRPKSVIGVPAADGPVNRPSVGRISMVTVEAERQKVNVNADPHDQVRGGTGYPRLERNSIDAGQMAEIVNPSRSGEAGSRKSIVGNERERAEVLSSIKKGILKRNNTSSESGSPVLRPVDVGQIYGSSQPNSPGTPTNDKRKHEDYFAKPPRILNGSTRSLPTTPQAGRNISFSPRIQFHDAWSPSDYDRRGDIATCNRLTPMLAQQIKEELNSFKMEMEVHESSKPHTHFF